MVQFKVGIVQSISRASLSDIPSVTFSRELVNSYLDEDVPILSSNDAEEIYKFIKQNAKEYNIYRYVLHINSAIMTDFINYIYEKKICSSRARSLLSKCIFAATSSNADSVRELNILKNTKIYFCLSRISTVLSNIKGIPPNNIMLVASDYVTPYFNQVYDVDISPKCRVSSLTFEMINTFVSLGGYKIVASLATVEEYDKFVSAISNSNFDGELNMIELDFPETLIPLANKVIITTNSSGVGICGNISSDYKINKFVLYENTALVLAKNWKNWKNFVKSNVISVGESQLSSLKRLKLQDNVVDDNVVDDLERFSRDRTGVSTRLVEKELLLQLEEELALLDLERSGKSSLHDSRGARILARLPPGGYSTITKSVVNPELP